MSYIVDFFIVYRNLIMLGKLLNFVHGMILRLFFPFDEYPKFSVFQIFCPNLQPKGIGNITISSNHSCKWSKERTT